LHQVNRYLKDKIIDNAHCIGAHYTAGKLYSLERSPGSVWLNGNPKNKTTKNNYRYYLVEAGPFTTVYLSIRRTELILPDLGHIDISDREPIFCDLANGDIGIEFITHQDNYVGCRYSPSSGSVEISSPQNIRELPPHTSPQDIPSNILIGKIASDKQFAGDNGTNLAYLRTGYEYQKDCNKDQFVDILSDRATVNAISYPFQTESISGDPYKHGWRFLFPDSLFNCLNRNGNFDREKFSSLLTYATLALKQFEIDDGARPSDLHSTAPTNCYHHRRFFLQDFSEGLRSRLASDREKIPNECHKEIDEWQAMCRQYFHLTDSLIASQASADDNTLLRPR
jgi:hypothetical protein